MGMFLPVVRVKLFSFGSATHLVFFWKRHTSGMVANRACFFVFIHVAFFCIHYENTIQKTSGVSPGLAIGAHGPRFGRSADSRWILSEFFSRMTAASSSILFFPPLSLDEDGCVWSLELHVVVHTCETCAAGLAWQDNGSCVASEAGTVGASFF